MDLPIGISVQTTQESGLIEGQAITQERPSLTDREREVAALARAGLAKNFIRGSSLLGVFAIPAMCATANSANL